MLLAVLARVLSPVLRNTVLWKPFKLLLHLLSGASELERVCLASMRPARRCISVRDSIAASSKLGDLSSGISDTELDAERAVALVIRTKCVPNRATNVQFTTQLRLCIERIVELNRLLVRLEARRSSSFDSDNPQHEAMLLDLWQLLCPDTVLDARLSSMWGDIGFQGKDPKTDFRGMGLLGLEDLVYDDLSSYFARTYPAVARECLRISQDQQYGFPFAVTGINLTGIAYQLLKSKALEATMLDETPSLDRWHQIYCDMFVRFAVAYPAAKPATIMQFGPVRDAWIDELTKQLRRDEFRLGDGIAKMQRDLSSSSGPLSS